VLPRLSYKRLTTTIGTHDEFTGGRIVVTTTVAITVTTAATTTTTSLTSLHCVACDSQRLTFPQINTRMAGAVALGRRLYRQLLSCGPNKLAGARSLHADQSSVIDHDSARTVIGLAMPWRCRQWS
jgi:hypothetical protein